MKLFTVNLWNDRNIVSCHFFTRLFVMFTIIFSASGCSPQSDVQQKGDVVLPSVPLAKKVRFSTVEENVEALLTQLTLEEKSSLVHASGKFHINAIERLGIPEMWLSDGPHGVRHQIERDSWASANWTDDHATYLPHLTSVAASFNVEMAMLHGDVLGSEARHRNKDYILGPGVNLARLPLYGRNFEYMGEDPILAAKLVVPEIKAIQNHDVAATVKHYALNTQELNRIGVNAKPDERTLREVYLPAFEAAVKEGGVYSLMGAYNEYYGTNANQSKYLVNDILKGEWEFDGVLLTDWHVDINTYDAAMNGLDLEMGTKVASYDDYFFAKPLIAMIESGKIPMSVLDDKVRRILRIQHRIGMMDKNRLIGSRNTKAHQFAARKIATEGVILLKNEPVNVQAQLSNTSNSSQPVELLSLMPVLPLDAKKIKNILVLGPNADKKHGQGGGSSEVKSLYEITPLAGLKAKLGDDVNIEVMRARSSVLSPIASDYVSSRHWTGTPAWNISYFLDETRKQVIDESWIVDSAFIADDGKTQFITMTADITPLKTGVHTLKLINDGEYRLKINDDEILSTSDEKTLKDVSLVAGQAYKFEITYSGAKGFTLGWNAPGNLFTEEAVYLAAAEKADAVIYFGGLSHGDDRESIDRKNMKLPNQQDEIITKLLAVNPNTVVFLVAGSAVEMPWVDQANAIIWGWYGGMEAGHAFSDILFGDKNPSGKLPITLPVKLEDTAPIALNDYNAKESLYSEGIFIGYRWFEQQNIQPLFPFGHGLSYTEFELSDISLSSAVMKKQDTLTVKVTVKNTGAVAGAEVVQLYINDRVSSVERPLKELKNFSKVFLNPKESKTISLDVNVRDLSFWDINNKNWLAESGEFEILLGNSLENILQRASFIYQQDE